MHKLLIADTQTSTLLNCLYQHDVLSFEHSLRVGKLMDRAVHIMPMEEEVRQEWIIAALLHDIGKLKVSTEILNKSRALNEIEKQILFNHCKFGYEIVSDLNYSQLIIDGIYYHHERLDGSGYPQKLKANQIPELSQMLSVLDSYDAMCSDRPYKKACPRLLAERELNAFIDEKYNRKFVNILKRVNV